ncbi:MAG: hypothetical protein LBU23_02740 [Planctomycetota bacterium]|nr:hypothetical protein [Planctomycetota bacterium]
MTKRKSLGRGLDALTDTGKRPQKATDGGKGEARDVEAWRKEYAAAVWHFVQTPFRFAIGDAEETIAKLDWLRDVVIGAARAAEEENFRSCEEARKERLEVLARLAETYR